MYRLVEGDMDILMLEIIHDGDIVLQFSVEDVKPEARDWLGKVLDDGFTDSVRRATIRERQRIQQEIKALLGIRG